MSRTSFPNLQSVLAVGLIVMSAGPALSQSGTRRALPVNRRQLPAAELKHQFVQPEADKPAAPDRQETKSADTSPSVGLEETTTTVPRRPVVTMDGLDVVKLLQDNERIRGVEAYSTTFDGQRYRFADGSSLNRFLASPKDYAPVLGGLSVVAFVDEARLQLGAGEFARHQGRLYLFADSQEKSRFLESPRRYEDADVVLDGFSPVALVDEEKLKRGDTRYEVVYDGRRHRLHSAEELQQFRAEPGRYYPTMGGIDPVSIVKKHPAIGGIHYSVHYKNRLYLLSSEENRKEFMRDPEPYSDLDVANDGRCPVTAVEEGRTVKGNFALSEVHLGRRFLFASRLKQQQFRQDPARYASAGEPHSDGLTRSP